MRIQIVKWVSILALLSAVLFWNSVATFQLALNLFVCMAAAVVTLQAFGPAHRLRYQKSPVCRSDNTGLSRISRRSEGRRLSRF